MRRALFYIVPWTLTAVGGAMAAAFDLVGGRDLTTWLAVAAGAFVLVTVARETDRWLAPRPRVRVAGRNDAHVVWTRGLWKGQPGHFLRIAFVNEAREATGEPSVARDIVARLSVRPPEGAAQHYVGKWAEPGDPPAGDPSRIAELERYTLPPTGQSVTLDVALFRAGAAYCQWTNRAMAGQESLRELSPGFYIVEILVQGSNVDRTRWRGGLTVADTGLAFSLLEGPRSRDDYGFEAV